MPLKKIAFKPGINREATRYSNEVGWYESDKVRFRGGFPEKIGGWERISNYTFLGACRSLWSWLTLGAIKYTGVGTNIKFYVEGSGIYNDITPIRSTTSAGAVTFDASNGSSTITVTDIAHGAFTGDFVTFSGAVSLGGNITAAVLNHEYEVTVTGADTYTITAKNTSGVTVTANASDTGDGGANVVGAYQINTTPEYVLPTSGYSAGPYGLGNYNEGEPSTMPMRLWSQTNFGEDLIFNPRDGAIYYWDSSAGTTNNRAVNLTTLSGASDVPIQSSITIVSDLYRFVFSFGTNTIGTSTIDPLLIRWSDQEDAANWTPAATNQAGFLQLSRGSQIVAVTQSRQELLVWTDSSLYSLQYLGAPTVWGAQLVGDNISIIAQNAVAYINGIAYWMGDNEFYMYDGRVQSLVCDVKRYIFNDINRTQAPQIFGCVNTAFNEVWWFYCSSDSDAVDRYVIYNFVDRSWTYGTMARTAWIDSKLNPYPIAATYSNNIVNHEYGLDDNETAPGTAITASITSGQFDLDDGDRFAFIWRIMPDITFTGSTATSPAATMTLLPLANSGSGYNNPTSEGGSNTGTVTRSVSVPVEEYTQQINVRVRGRQMSFKIESTGEGVTWQLGSPRIDIRPDGRR
jgi:hypothetical protein